MEPIITFASDIPFLTPKWERLPATARVSAKMPDFIKGPMRETIRRLRGKTPCHHMRALNALCEPARAAAESDDECLNIIRQMTAAFIELAKMDENKVDDPFFASIYRYSVKANHADAAASYIRANGGWDAVEKTMRDWLAAHPDIAEDPETDGPQLMAGANIEPETPETPRQSVERIAGMAREMLSGTGRVTPVYAVLDHNGRGVMFMMKSYGTKAELSQFFSNAQNVGAGMVPDACRAVRATEAWASESDTVRPSKSATRREIINVLLWDENEGIDGELSMMNIDRDADGKPVAGVLEYGVGHSQPADFSAL